MSNAPAGWYPDPAAVGVTPPPLRYWDGDQWTEHRSMPAASAYSNAPTTPDGVPLAGWWHRVGATLIDSVFATIVSVIFTIPAQISIQRSMTSLQDQFQRRLDANRPGTLTWFFHRMLDIYRPHLWEYAVPVIVVLIAQTCFLHLLGGTPGQLLTKLRVRRPDVRGPIGWARAFVRVLVSQSISGLLLILCIVSGSLAAMIVSYLVVAVWGLLDPLWAAWDRERQTLHDKVVDTMVVKAG